MRREDLTATQRRVLDAIAEAYLERSELLGRDQLAALLQISAAEVQSALDGLEAAGMLSKRSHTRE